MCMLHIDVDLQCIVYLLYTTALHNHILAWEGNALDHDKDLAQSWPEPKSMFNNSNNEPLDWGSDHDRLHQPLRVIAQFTITTA